MLQSTIVTRRITAKVIAIAYLLLILAHEGTVLAKNDYCDTIGGQSNIIVDIEESRKTAVDQNTIPEELPIIGEPGEDISLELNFKNDRKLFGLEGKKLKLLEPIDRDAGPKSYVIFELSCMVLTQKKRRNIPVIVRITDINDNAPEFLNTPYETTISELTPIGTTIYRNVYAKDKDAGLNERVEYKIVPSNRSSFERVTIADGFSYFDIHLSHEGQVVVNRSLDFEKTQRYLVTIVASDRARNVDDRFSSTATLTVNIQDADDQDPTFVYRGCMIFEGSCINPEYSATVLSGKLSGVVTIHPERIQAVDMDSLNSPIKYSFSDGFPASYSDYFEINGMTAQVVQKKIIETSMIKQFEITVKAEEISNNSRSTVAKLKITVKPVDSNPPKLHASATQGYVDENSEIDTIVVDEMKAPIMLTVTDDDFEIDDPKPSYVFEITTNSFRIDDNGYLVVNNDQLDRDPPNQEVLKFQVVAKEINGSATSAPLAVTVKLNDVNDNAPILPTFAPIYIQAEEGKREIIKVNAVDKDFGKNAVIKYSIYYVSNNERKKFRIDENTGILESTSKLSVGDHYSITVEASDLDGLKSQAIVEIFVKPGPNTRSPIFSKHVYEVQVSEGVSVNATVATVTAKDPENDSIRYSLVLGDDLKQFNIDSNTGLISIIRKLDREELTRYQLVIKAEDSGRLSSSATVNIIVTDINDKNPEFDNLPYRFEVEEGRANQTVGVIHATDLDEGVNAKISYFVPKDVPFKIDGENGQIFTKEALDYEKDNMYKIVVTAQDSGTEPRIATCTVTIHIIDVEDELPAFPKTLYEVSLGENLPQYPVVRVEAIDKDLVKRVNYEIREGAKDLFQIDDKTGEIFTTTKGLDYETDNLYVLIVGTIENNGSKSGDFTKVVVKVEDRNDMAPSFIKLPKPVTLDDETEIGARVYSLMAIDSEGTSPGNKVKYELIGTEKSKKYFQIDPDNGMVLVKGDLKKEADNEYEIDVRAYDLGEPQLYSIATLHIFVRHIATVAPEMGIGFSDDSYTIQMFENATKGNLIKILKIANSHKYDIPLKCYIISGNNDGKFLINTTEDRNCALYLNETLDFETADSYNIDLQIDSLQGFVDPDKSTAILHVSVVDINDNKPYFVYTESFNELVSENKFYAAIPWGAEIATSVVQIGAEDHDSGRYGKLEYRLLGDKYSLKYFSIDRNSGTIGTKKSFDDVSDADLPFKLMVQVNDNPNATTLTNYIETPLVINLISEENRMILVIGDASPDKILNEKTIITNTLRDHSNLLVGVEKITTRHYFNENGSLVMDSLGSDIWFYAIDPESEKILQRNHSRVQRSIFLKDAMDKITFDITATVKHTAFNIHEPLVMFKVRSVSTAAAYNSEFLPYAVISVGCMIFMICVAGIAYLYMSWSKYKTVKDQSQQSNYSSTINSNHYHTYSRKSPQYDHRNYVEPSLKEYETQILQMTVPVDETESHKDVKLDFRPSKATYVCKEYSTPIQSDVMATRVATLKRVSNGTLRNGYDTITDSTYKKPCDQEWINRSATNENVTFKEKKDLKDSPKLASRLNHTETTTEL